MALQSSGPISLGNIRTELNSVASNFSLNSAENGTYGSINQSSVFKPNGATPNRISEWYGYDHLAINISYMLIGGDFVEFNGSTRNKMVKADDYDGSIDTTFNIGGTGFTTNRSVTKIADDGGSRYHVGGSFTTYNGVSTPRFTILSTTGSIISGFSPGTGFNNSVNDILPHYSFSTGAICVGGFTSYNGVSYNRIAKVLYNGSISSTFSVGSGFNATTHAISSYNNVVVGGDFTTYQGTTRNRIIRLTGTGSIDTSFSIGSGFDSTVHTITHDGAMGGRILVGGIFTSYNGTSQGSITRLISNGTIDGTFSTNIGSGFNDRVRAITIQYDGKILVGGDFSTFDGNFNNAITRLNSDGTIDGTFSTNIGGGFTKYDINFDTNFTGKVYAIELDYYNNYIMVGGEFDSLDSNPVGPNIVKLNMDGTIASTYSAYTFTGGFGGSNTGIVRTILSLTELY
jgi:Domain of unknown function (DUF5122) beta-propeller